MIKAIWNHLTNWVEVYLWVPASLLGIFGAAGLAYLLTGHKPTEDANWLVDYSSKAVEMVAIIALTSIAKQALGHWMTPEERNARPYLATINTFATLVTFLTVTYVFLH